MGDCIMGLDEMPTEDIADGNATLTKVRGHLTQESIGMNVIELKGRSGTSGFTRHSHSDDGYEETYFVISGSGEVQINDGDWQVVGEGSFVHVDPTSERAFRTNSDEGLTLLAVSGTPGKVYAPPAWSELDFDPSSDDYPGIQTLEDAMFGGPIDASDAADLQKADEELAREQSGASKQS